MKGMLGKIKELQLLEKLELDNKKIILIVLACIVFLYVDFNFLLKSQLQVLKTIEPKVSGLKRDLDNLSADLAKMQELKKKQMGPVQKPAVKLKKIISSEQVAALLQELSDTANKNSVKIEQIKQSKEAQISSKQKLTGSEKFQPVLIALDLTGDYHHFGMFINDIENGQTLISVQSMKISFQQADNSKQKVNLMLKAYVKK